MIFFSSYFPLHSVLASHWDSCWQLSHSIFPTLHLAPSPPLLLSVSSPVCLSVLILPFYLSSLLSPFFLFSPPLFPLNMFLSYIHSYSIPQTHLPLHLLCSTPEVPPLTPSYHTNTQPLLYSLSSPLHKPFTHISPFLHTHSHTLSLLHSLNPTPFTTYTSFLPSFYGVHTSLPPPSPALNLNPSTLPLLPLLF